MEGHCGHFGASCVRRVRSGGSVSFRQVHRKGVGRHCGHSEETRKPRSKSPPIRKRVYLSGLAFPSLLFAFLHHGLHLGGGSL